MTRLGSRAFAAALFAVVAGACCSSLVPRARADDARVDPHTIPHVLRYATGEDLSTLNPVLDQQGVLAQLSQLTMAYLVRYDRSNRPVPELATAVPTLADGGISPDGKMITFHLRRGVKWSDGAPFDADDVVYTERQMLNPANVITSRAGWDKIAGLDEPDKYTVVLHLSEPYSPFLPTFFGSAGGGPCILPKHILGGLAEINDAPYNALPVGIGPFRYAAWKRGDEIDLEANPYYWRGKPKLQKFVYRIITDRNTVLTALQTGDVDLVWPVGGASLARYRTLPYVTLLRQPGYSYDHLDFNLTSPVLADKAVRQALRYAYDRATIREDISRGVGFLQESTVPPGYPGAPKIQSLPFDIARANRLLDNDGWVPGSDGVRVKDGRRFAFEIASTSGTPDVDTMLELLRGWWEQIGAEITIKRYLPSMLFAPAPAGGIVLGGRFDGAFAAFTVSPVDDLSGVFGCDAIPPGGQNFSHYCNRKIDPYLADFRRTYDPQRQAADLGKIESIVVDDTPMIVASFREDIFAYNRDLKNFHPNAVSFMDDFMNVDI